MNLWMNDYKIEEGVCLNNENKVWYFLSTGSRNCRCCKQKEDGKIIKTVTAQMGYQNMSKIK